MKVKELRELLNYYPQNADVLCSSELGYVKLGNPRFSDFICLEDGIYCEACDCDFCNEKEENQSVFVDAIAFDVEE